MKRFLHIPENVSICTIVAERFGVVAYSRHVFTERVDRRVMSTQCLVGTETPAADAIETAFWELCRKMDPILKSRDSEDFGDESRSYPNIDDLSFEADNGTRVYGFWNHEPFES